MRLEGKVALVTGAASGMGRAIALRYAEEGASVCVVDIDRPSGELVTHMIRDLGGDAEFVQCDVSIREQASQAVAATVRRFGMLHILVNDAGIYDLADGPIEYLSEQTWDRVLAVNLKGPFYFCKYAIPEIVTCGGGAVVNISSTAGLTASDRPAYGASKGALIAMTRAVARQYGADNVRANVICPGPIDTPLRDRILEGRGEQDPEQEPAAPSVPLMIKRVGRPEEVADVALFLASDDASYITAAVYPVDGGLSAL